MRVFVRTSSFVFLLALLTLFGSEAFGQYEPDREIDDLVKRADQNGRRIALYFHSEKWESLPKLFDVIPDAPVVRDYLNQYRILFLDADSDRYKNWRKRYDLLKVYPSLVLLGNEGQSLGYLTLQDVELEDVLTFFVRSEMVARSQANSD